MKKQIYEILNRECPPNQTPCPHKVIDDPEISCELLGFFFLLLCLAFDRMRKSNGETNWEFGCSYFFKKAEGKNKLTKNALRKMLIACLNKNLITGINEVGDEEFMVQINADHLFEKLEESD